MMFKRRGRPPTDAMRLVLPVCASRGTTDGALLCYAASRPSSTCRLRRRADSQRLFPQASQVDQQERGNELHARNMEHSQQFLCRLKTLARRKPRQFLLIATIANDGRNRAEARDADKGKGGGLNE